MTKTDYPKVCPTCGCNTMSPFPWQTDVIIHDVEECARRDRRHERLKSIPQCPHCGEYAVTVGATYTDFECGSTWCDIEGFERSENCRNKTKGD